MSAVLTSPDLQLTFPLDGDIRPKPLLRSLQQEQAFQAVLANLRADAKRLLKAAIALSGIDFSSLTEVPTPLLKSAREAVDGPQQAQVPPRRTDCIAENPYKPWSKRRKYGDRVRRLMLRVRKSTSLWYGEFLQTAVLENPEYFGVCPLPSESICMLNLDQRLRDDRKVVAIARENQLRALAQ